MHRQFEPEVIAEYLADARSYLPAIRKSIAAGAGDGHSPEEAFRHVHTIRGGAAMLGLDALGEVALRLEESLEHLLAADTAEVRDFVDLGVARLEQCLTGLTVGVPVPAALVAEVRAAYERVAHLLGGDPAPAAPEDWTPDQLADELPAELREVFLLEAADHFQSINALLPRLEQQPHNQALVQEVRRSVHTLKGAAAMVGFQEITRLTHRMEDYLDNLAEGTATLAPEAVRLLYDATDSLESLAAGKCNAAALRGLYRRFGMLVVPAQPQLPLSVMKPNESPPLELPPVPLTGTVSAPDEQTVAKGATWVRVPLRQLDGLVNLVGELVIARGSFVERMQAFERLVAELQPTAKRLKNAAYKLETQFEASALGGGPIPGVANGNGAGREPRGNGPVNRLLAGFRSHGFDDLEFDRYTEFHLLSRDLTETTADIETVAGELSHLIRDFDGYLTRQRRLVTEMEDRLVRVRMVPLATLLTRLQRGVRTTAQQLGKDVAFVIEGEETGLDQSVLEQLADPLLHLLRNAVDHGIEPPAVRRASGKAARGLIRLSAAHEGNQVVLRLADDGAGIDVDRVRAAAVLHGLVSGDDAERLTTHDLWELIFQPGFSTADAISEISGRGIGLDVVRSLVRKLKGTVSVHSEPGAGATFTIRLPLTLALTRALLVQANQQTFALPLDAVRQLTRINLSDVDQSGPSWTLRFDGQTYPVLRLGEVLNLKQATEKIERPPVVLIDTGDRTAALLVDRVLGSREIVVKSLGSHLRRVHGVWGATVMGDGSVVLILNPPELTRLADRPRGPSTATRRAPAHRHSILIADDSPSVRKVLATLIQRAGWEAMVAKDGLDALEMLHLAARLPDLVLLDVEMPRMDGFELLGTLRGQAPYRQIPVIMVTSRAGEKHRQKAVELGANAYVVKPYQDETLLQLINRLVRRPQVVATA